MKGSTVFLTGAEGLLGNHVTRELISRNNHVKVLIESGKSNNTLVGLENMTFCYGNILDAKYIERETRDCNYIIHAAASISVYPSKNPLVQEINFTGTKNIISAAIKNKTKKVIHVGSANSFGFGTLMYPGNETTPFNCGKFNLDYIDSKYLAHQEVLNAIKTYSLPAIVVCPTFMLGKYDSKPGSGALVASIYNKSLPGYSKGGKNYIYVNDVAVAIVNALELGRIGESYILGHQNLTYKDAFELIARTIGVKAPSLGIPKWIITLYGGANQFICELLNKTPRVTYSIARISNETFYYDSSKAVNELKLPQTPIDVAVKECFEWLKENNLLNHK